MSYLVNTPTIKKKFCNHEYKIIFPLGTKKETKVCIKCKKKFEPKIKTEKNYKIHSCLRAK